MYKHKPQYLTLNISYESAGGLWPHQTRQNVLFRLAWWITDLQLLHLDIILDSSVMLATWVQCSQQHTWFLPPSTDNNNHFDVFSSSDVQQYICILGYVVKFCKIHPMFYCMLFVWYFAYLTFLYLNLLTKMDLQRQFSPLKSSALCQDHTVSTSGQLRRWHFCFFFLCFYIFYPYTPQTWCEFINQVSSTSH